MCFGGGGSSSSSSSSSGGGRDRDAAMDPFGRGGSTSKSFFQTAAADLSYGLGLSKDKPYGYDARTEQGLQRAEAERERERQSRDDNDRPAPTPARTPAPAPVRTSTASTSAPTPPGAPGTGPAGAAEQAVEEGAKTRKGRASTIATSPEGLMSEAKTRERRSLMGGLIR